MKKTLIALLSIMLIAFAFTACDNSNSGNPGKPTVEEAEAKNLATTYMGAINYGALIVEAFDESNTALAITPETNGFTIEFDEYKGTALDTSDKEEEGAIELSQIKSGALKFTFPVKTGKAVESTPRTEYTIETVEDKPLVFVDKENKELAAFEFSASGTASGTRFNVMGGMIVGLEEEATITINKPTKATISVGNVSVKYDEIENDVEIIGGGSGEVVPEETFTESAALTAITSIIDDISMNKLKTDMMKGLTGGDGDDVPNVTLVGDISVKYRGTEDLELKNLLLGVITGTASQTEPSKELQAKLANIYDVSIEMTVSFDYYNAFKDALSDPNHAATYADTIKSGTINLKIIPGTGDLKTTKLAGIYTVSTVANDPLVVITKNNEIYSIALTDFAGTFALEGTSKADVCIPAKTDASSTIKITKDSESQTLDWTDIASRIEQDSNFAEQSAELIDATYFYQHLGTLRFLNSVYAVFSEAENDDSNGLSFIKTGITLDAEKEQFTLALKLTDYEYYREDSFQRASGNVNITFKGTLNEDDDTFTATTFTIASTTLSLSDDATGTVRVRSDATVTLSGDGKIGDKAEGTGTGIVFTTSEDHTAISGIKDYDSTPEDGEVEYSQENQEFVFTGETLPEIKLSTN